MALKVVSHSPSINATGVYRNEVIRVNFDRAIQPATVSWDTLSVHDKASYSTVVGSLGTVWTSSGTVIQVTFTPETNLLPNTDYCVYVYESPNSILGLDGSEVNRTYSWDFTTGIQIYDNVSESGTIPSGEAATSVTDTLSGYYITSTYPQNQQPNVLTNIGQVEIRFNANIATSPSDMSGYVTIDVKDVLE